MVGRKPDEREGLSQVEAEVRLKADGPNELPNTRGRGPGRIALQVLAEPMFLLLVSAGALYLALGDLADAVSLLVAVVLMFAITVAQEYRTERVLVRLRDLTSPRALVVRDGERRRIPGGEVVRGDLLLVAEGDRVAADAALLAGGHLEVDESLLTGEAMPVRKVAWDGVQVIAPPGGDDLPFLFAGSLVVRGQGIARVLRTGRGSCLGQLGAAMAGEAPPATPIRLEVRRLVRLIALFGGALCVALVVLLGWRHGAWLEACLGGITLAMTLLPVEYPVVLTVFLALGAWRLSQRHVLTRRLSALEALGATSLLAVDKTGTLTQNRMEVATLVIPGQTPEQVADGQVPLSGAGEVLLEFGILASAVNPFDPMEKAFRAVGERYFATGGQPHQRWQLAHEYGITPGLLAMTHVWQAAKTGPYTVAAKGAPEAILDLCHAGDAQIAGVMAEVASLARRGLRVIAVAHGTWPAQPWPSHQHAFDYEFLGLVGLRDPLRAEVPQAVAECHAAGIAVVMITGDHAATAQAVAREAGLESGQVLCGEELASAPARALAACRVFARITPTQKLELVQRWMAQGAVVAMTGDGVNDAPALRAADIGIAMGERGSDVAREAASLVLTDGNFGALVQAIREGRRLFENLRAATAYVFAVHLPIAGIALLPVLFDWPTVLLPIHVMLLELVVDPVSSLVFDLEPEPPDLMRRPPRALREPLLSRAVVERCLLQGLVALGLVAASYSFALRSGASADAARGLALVAIVACNLSQVVANRSAGDTPWRRLLAPNHALHAVVAAVAGLFALAFSWEPMARVFRIGWPGAPALAVTLLTCLLVMLATGRTWRA